MPMPKPRPRENEQDFITRCMGNDTMVTDFPENNQRAAVCYQQWRDSRRPRSPAEKTEAKVPSRFDSLNTGEVDQ